MQTRNELSAEYNALVKEYEELIGSQAKHRKGSAKYDQFITALDLMKTQLADLSEQIGAAALREQRR